eukprot:9151777-Lingulodinium_polyedra.AAC.1
MDGGQQTGGVFAGIMRYIRKDRRHLRLLLLENVLGLTAQPRDRTTGAPTGPSNAHVVVSQLQAA